MTEQDKRKIREAMTDCLSGVDALPSMRADILRAAKGEKKVKRSLNKGLVLALVLILMMSSVAVAAGLGMFGQLGQREDADARMTGLETVSIVLDKDFYIGSDVTLTVNQAYYDGSRVFISYTVEGDYQGAGLNIHDGMQIGDEYIDIIGGDCYDTEDGQMIGWKECEVPADLAADEVTFSIGTVTAGNVKETTVWHDFTVKKATASAVLTGTTQTANRSATATLTASAIDVKGKVVVACPDSWVEIWRTWENPDKIDYIREWVLYAGGAKVVGDNLDGGIDARVDGQLTFGICYKLDDLLQEMKLVPVYSRTGENMAEAISLTVAK